jgi:hypothetical protein
MPIEAPKTPASQDAALAAILKLSRRIESSALDAKERRQLRDITARLVSINGDVDKQLSKHADGNTRGQNARVPAPPTTSRNASPLQSPTAAAADAPDARLGQAVAAALYLLVEALLVRIEADRISLFLVNERTGDLQLAVNAGVGAHKPTRNSLPPLSTGLLSLAASTGVAVNLPWVTLEDIADCPGPTRGRNAIVCPIRREHSRSDASIGALIAVNCRRGTEPFSVDDEAALAHAAPSIAYLARQYPIDYGVLGFDFTSLHRVRPLDPTPAAPLLRLPAGWTFPIVQMVYHREGPEKYIRREQLRDGEVVPADTLDTVADHLRTVREYIDSLRRCWRTSVEERMETERQLRQRQALITDAQEILHRKQAKLRLIKDVLCEQMEHKALHTAAREKKMTTTTSFRKQS